MNDFNEIIKKLEFYETQIASGQVFRKLLLKSFILDFKEEISPEEADELLEKALDNLKGIDFQIIKGFETIFKIIEGELPPSAVSEVRRLFNQTPNSYGTGFYFKEFLNLLLDLFEGSTFVLNVGVNTSFEPFADNTELCTAYGENNFEIIQGSLGEGGSTDLDDGVYIFPYVGNETIFQFTGLDEEDYVIVVNNNQIGEPEKISTYCAPSVIEYKTYDSSPTASNVNLCPHTDPTEWLDKIWITNDDTVYIDEELTIHAANGWYVIQDITGAISGDEDEILFIRVEDKQFVQFDREENVCNN